MPSVLRQHKLMASATHKLQDSTTCAHTNSYKQSEHVTASRTVALQDTCNGPSVTVLNIHRHHPVTNQILTLQQQL
jgi:hypothetical protein